MILLIADSVCGGFGQLDKKSFIHITLEAAGIEIWDHSATGMTTNDYLDFLQTGNKIVKEQYDLYQDKTVFSHVIIALGNVDCKGRYAKNNFLSNLIPTRYRKEKLDPRPYYSRKYIKKTIQTIENFIRTTFRWYLYITRNLEPATPSNDLKDNIITLIKKHQESNIILISPSRISDKFFPGSKSRFDHFDTFLKNQINNRVHYFDMRSSLTSAMLLEDHFHLNQAGHLFLAKRFENFIQGIRR